MEGTGTKHEQSFSFCAGLLFFFCICYAFHNECVFLRKLEIKFILETKYAHTKKSAANGCGTDATHCIAVTTCTCDPRGEP